MTDKEGEVARPHNREHDLDVGYARNAGVAQSVERQPSKLNVAGSRPVSRSNPPSPARAQGRSRPEPDIMAA
jgi:hypothetical protein